MRAPDGQNTENFWDFYLLPDFRNSYSKEILHITYTQCEDEREGGLVPLFGSLKKLTLAKNRLNHLSEFVV